MRINADFSKRVVVRPEDSPWLPSPMTGVERRLLDRIGDEVARATSIVRYTAGSSFSQHSHPGGEEFLVLEGVFSDEHGDYPAGSYVRNPIGTRHTPFSRAGCTLLVKLYQFDTEDRQPVCIDTANATWQPAPEPGLQVIPLHQFGREQVTLQRWAPGTRLDCQRHWGGEEILVLEGSFQDEHGDYPSGTWLRRPHLAEYTPISEHGCLLWVKTGHLPE